MVNDILINALFHSSARCIKSFTSCTSLLWTRCWIVPHCRSCSQLDWSQRCSAATNLEIYMGDHDHWDNCTFWVEAANDAQAVWVNTACGKEHSQKKNLSKLILWYRIVYNQITSDIICLQTDNSLRMLTTDKLQLVLFWRAN